MSEAFLTAPCRDIYPKRLGIRRADREEEASAHSRGSARVSSGQSLVEFALVFPVFILLLLGILDLGRMAYAYNTVAYAARQGARHGTISPTPSSGVANMAKGSMPALDANLVTVTVSYPDGASYSGTRIQVEVSYSFYAATPIISRVWGGGAFVLRATSTMYIE